MISWQEWQGSNLRPPVLETGALPIELHSCTDRPSPSDPRRFKHRLALDGKGEAADDGADVLLFFRSGGAKD